LPKEDNVKQKVACIIPAAGWGSLCPVRSTSKVLEDTEGELMICRIVRTVKEANFAETIVVVIGPDDQYGPQIREALMHAGHTDLKFVVQPERKGAANAVELALSALNGEEHVLVTFGDMPLWRASTFRDLVLAHLGRRGKLRDLIQVYLTRQGVSVSMVTLKLKPGHRTERYGRIVRDEHGHILAALEPNELAGVDLGKAKTVNPSLYVFERKWLQDKLALIPPVDKGDGFHPEYHLPKLLPIAHDQGAYVLERPLKDPSEALGVNKSCELEEVQQALRERNGN